MQAACEKPMLMRGLSCIALVLSSFMLNGCLVRAAADVVTAPVKVVSAGVDAATTSQSEADAKRGRELREPRSSWANSIVAMSARWRIAARAMIASALLRVTPIQKSRFCSETIQP